MASSKACQRVSFEAVHRFNPVLMAARFRLANGLRIVLMPDRRAAVFAFQTWFCVGSKHEDPGLTGIAHLFEHLMFKGTHAHPPGAFDREMERRGSQTNAATWVDWTYYTEALAARSDNLETVVGFEVDRMTNLILDEATFRSELEVVKNERRMMVDDSVTGALSELLYATAYTEHPYRWPTIGSMQHLEAATPAELERFYRTYYAPNNATLVLVGALDPIDTLTLLAKSYGPLPPQSIPAPPDIVEPKQEAAKLVLMERPVVAPQMMIAFHAPAQGDPRHAQLEMLSEILTAGDNARLYRRLVTDDRLATELVGYVSPFAEPGLYEIVVTARPGAEPERIIDAVQQEVERVCREPLSIAEVDKARNGLELALLEGLGSVEGCAEALGHFETTRDDFSEAFAGPAAWADATPDDLMRAAASIFRPENRTTVAALPAGKVA